MSSYYNRVTGSLNASEIARSEDIHLIQSGIQSALQEMIRDIFGAGCILGEGETSLELTPTPYRVDQENQNYDNEEDTISFYDRYLRQTIEITKSEIQAIKVELLNTSEIAPTVYAEIRDTDWNLLKETNIILTPTKSNEPEPFTFTFNLNHLPIGEYYFCLRPVDIEAVDVATSPNGNIYNTIDSDTFKIRFDKSGNYKEGLEASYNGVDFLEARLLGDQVQSENMTLIPYDSNFDLCFEHVFSAGNTYVIEDVAPCMVMGEKVYPIDTHVSIDGPSSEGDRVDLVTLTPDGYLNVTKGLPFTGTQSEDNYPVVSTGLKIAYITTYRTSEPWTCPDCGTTNDASSEICSECSHPSIATKIPLIEQDDENGMTRQRDVLERLRRLEKRMTYNEDYNTPSRIKYTCDIDPTLIIDAATEKDSNELIFIEDTYKMKPTTDENGNTVVESSDIEGNRTLEWTIIDKVTTTTVKTVKKAAILKVYELTIPATKPKKVDKNKHWFHAKVYEVKKTTTTDKKTKKTTTTKKEIGVKGVPITFKIKDSNKKVKKTIDLTTNKDGDIQFDIWKHKLKKGKYTVTATHKDTKKSVSVALKIEGDEYKTASGSKKVKIKVPEQTKEVTEDKIDKSKTFVGDDSFYKDGGVIVDTEKGIVTLKDNKVTKKNYKKVTNLSSDNLKKLKSSSVKYKIKASSNSLQSEYGAVSFQIDKKCKIKSITPSITKFKNIKYYTIILFKNNKIFNINTTRKSYTKKTKPNKNDATFPDIYNVSNDLKKWVNVKKKGKKNKSGIVEIKKHKFSFEEQELEPGTYTMAVLGILDDPKKDGAIYVKQYHTSQATKYGASSKLKGTSGTKGPQKLYIEANSLNNRTWNFEMEKAEITHHTSGTLISKTVTTSQEITAVKVYSNFYIPNGCSIATYVSNNGGKTYTQVTNSSVVFNGTGRDFKWRIELKGTQKEIPKMYYKNKKNKKYAIRFKLTTMKRYVGYEDYGRCFATPLLNANAITQNVLENSLIKNKFEEWEYCRLWMEDEGLNAQIDICFSYANDNYVTNVTTPQKSWSTDIFFNQIFANLNLKDFSRESVDYSNYTADVEEDEYNYRFKLNSDYLGNAQTQTITTPLASAHPENYDYVYGNISNDITPIDNYFTYGLTYSDVVYKGNTGTITNVSTGLHLLSGPYFQATFNPDIKELSNSELQVTNDDTEEDDDETETTEGTTEGTTEEETVTTDKKVCVWASDDTYGVEYTPEACIIGISFDNGLQIKDQYTHLILDVIPNLHDCVETDGAVQFENGYPINAHVTDTTKYQYPASHPYADSFYIPANTLEIVIALNPYGIIESDDATYGKTYVIDQDLISCVHNQVSLDLTDLYNTTIYSVGIRVNTQKDEEGEYYVKWTTDKNDDSIQKHPSLHAGDVLGIGNLSFEAYNKRSYAEYLYTGNASRFDWHGSDDYNDAKKSQVFGQIHLKKENESSNYWTQFDLITKDKSDTDAGFYTKSGTKLTTTNYLINTFDYNKGEIVISPKNINGTAYNSKYYNTNESADTIFFLAESELGNLFEIDVDITLTPYDYIDVQYHLDYPGQSTSGSERGISKGDIYIDLYDVTDIHGAEPIQRLPLPAWGKIQNRGVVPNNDKTVNAWFKKYTTATKVKKIVLCRGNATQQTAPVEFKLHLVDILFVNSPTLPSLGPQMHVRIYPQEMGELENTKIRKFGCIYRLG